MFLQQRVNKNIGVEGAHHELNLGHRYGNCFELPLDHSVMGVHAHTHIYCKYCILHYISQGPYFHEHNSIFAVGTWSKTALPIRHKNTLDTFNLKLVNLAIKKGFNRLCGLWPDPWYK
jgi:hypothetical protein